MNPRTILVTSALPYANGDLHLGHLLEQIETDIWVRYQRLIGNNCYYICGDDAHGTPIMLLAEKLGVTTESLIKSFYEKHLTDSTDFLISFDAYGSTHTKENHEMIEYIYENLYSEHHIEEKIIEQAFDTEKNLFLPDRFIKGNCPKCQAPDQYGDNCEQCGTTYSPMDLLNPISVLSGTKPISKNSKHFFLKLKDFQLFLKQWLESEQHVPSAILNKLQEWFKEDLKSWDISRDGPYFGFAIPNQPDKFFYVWLDAPIGYLSIFKNFCLQNKIDFEKYWNINSEAEVHHFIGKDIVYFHALFWPAILSAGKFRLPNKIHVHGYLTVNGEKMSKSRGTFITARQYLKLFPAEALRYYFATKLNGSIEDIDLNLEEFRQKVNSDLVGKVVNLASRSASFMSKYFNNHLSNDLIDLSLWEEFVSTQKDIAKAYEATDYAKVTRLIMGLADKANEFFDREKPWQKIKQTGEKEKVQAICTQTLNHFKQLMIYLKPILPEMAEKAESFLNCTSWTWASAETALLKHRINEYQILFQRIEEKDIMEILPEKTLASNVSIEEKKETEYVSIEDFSKIDLRIGHIIAAEAVEGSDKLLKLNIDLGEEKPRQIFSGIKSGFTSESLIGKYVVVVANLAPRKMRFGISEGMVLLASNEENQLFLIEPQAGAIAGLKVK